jgi:hypothetical protein
MELGAGGQYFEMLQRGAPQYARGHLHLTKIVMRNDTPSELWAKGVDDGKIRRVLIPHGTGVYSVRISRGEEGNKRGTRHLHVGNLAADGQNEKPRGHYVTFGRATFFLAETLRPRLTVVSR